VRLFTCAVCKQILFFENVQCGRCGHTLAYLPEHRVVSALTERDGTLAALAPEASGARYRLCANYAQHAVCNWAVPAESEGALCRACRLNHVIPNLSSDAAKLAWHKLESAKRRVLYTLIELRLPIESAEDSGGGLGFSFKEDQQGEKVYTGHDDGLITINIAEADDAYREKMRNELGEPYRTVLGHVRHEIGHYYWDRLVRDSRWLLPFRALFGDERADYAAARTRHYELGPRRDWQSSCVSAYAAMHPWEDWAESFAHYLHIVDTLETARSYGIALRPVPDGGAQLPAMSARRLHFDDFGDLISAWFPLTIALNSLNRSMGLGDPYPFVLSDGAVQKLRFVHDVADDGATSAACPP
jgi:hypothetical protein